MCLKQLQLLHCISCSSSNHGRCSNARDVMHGIAQAESCSHMQNVLSRVFVWVLCCRKRFAPMIAMSMAIKAMRALMITTQRKNRNVACFQSCPGETPNRDTLRGVRLRNKTLCMMALTSTNTTPPSSQPTSPTTLILFNSIIHAPSKNAKCRFEYDGHSVPVCCSITCFCSAA